MVHIYLVYGLAFVLLASVTAFQAATSVRILPMRAMIFLSLFGVLHGSAEWVEIAKMIPSVDLPKIERLSSTLIVTSYVALFALGVELLVNFARVPKVARWATLPLTLFSLGSGYILAGNYEGLISMSKTLEIASRYFLATPGALLCCLGFFYAASVHTGQLELRLRKRLRWVALFFVFYAFFAGIVVPEAPFSPASLLNTRVFNDALGFPVILVRAACALGISLALVQAFIVEISRLNTLWGRLREEFISLVAHDLKSSLGAVKLASELLVEELPQHHPVEKAERLNKVARRILTTTDNLSRIVADLLDASLIAADRMTIRKQRVDVALAASSVIDGIKGALGGVKVVWQSAAKGVFADVDPVRLDQVLVNLLTNAKKYSKPGTPIAVSLEQKSGKVVFSIRNQADAVQLAELPRLFERYYRRTSHAAGVPGSGLGLYIVKGLVEAHGGEVGVKLAGSAEDYIEFFVSFPEK